MAPGLAATFLVVFLSLIWRILKRVLKPHGCISKKCWNGVLAFRKVAERCSGVFHPNLSTD